ncbi:MAG: LuxR C-terminal-related transcriptional regulator [Bacteroidota bacterium]
MGKIKIDEVKKTWFQIAKNVSSSNASFELEVYKKLQDMIHVGDYYYFIFNCSDARVEFTSAAVKQVLKLDSAEDFTIEHLLSIIHPVDLPYFLDFENRVTQFFNELPPKKVMNYKVSYDYRVRRNDGTYIRILQQAVTIQSDENGAVLRVLDIHTDITHLKRTNGSTLSFLGLNGETSLHDVSVGRVAFNPEKSPFTKREREVLDLLLQGKTSQQIAQELFISKLTVDGHRKKILSKSNSNSTATLTLKVINES